LEIYYNEKLTRLENDNTSTPRGLASISAYNISTLVFGAVLHKPTHDSKEIILAWHDTRISKFQSNIFLDKTCF